MKRKSLNLVFSIFLFFIFISSSYSVVEVFSKYDTKLIVTKNNTIEVEKNLKIKNVYDVGIIPGQIEFKIGRGVDGSIGSINILNVEAYDVFGNEINTKVVDDGEYSRIILDVFYPLLPDFEYEFNLNYKLKYEPGGIFFKSLQIPLRESTIPIDNGEFQVILPENYYFTYLSSEGENSTIEKNVAKWPIKNNMPDSVSFEYSYIPIKIGSFKGSYVFWILINVLLLIFLIYEVKREIRRVRSQYEK